MLFFINKYKRYIYLAVAVISIIMLFIPALSLVYNGVEYAKAQSTAALFNRATQLIYNLKTSKNTYYYGISNIDIIQSALTATIFGCIFIVAGILLAILTAIFINKPIPYSLSFILFSLATIIKIGSQCDFSVKAMGIYDAWTDYVIISIALLMLIVDIVRLSLYIRNHREQIAAKLSALKPPPRERKPSKDERIAELEERVRQLEDSKKDG